MLPLMLRATRHGLATALATALASWTPAACVADADGDDHAHSSESESSDHGHDDSSTAATTDDPTSSTAASNCAEETRADTYMLGLERSGERVTVRFVDAMPAPPARYDNTWVVDVFDTATGMPLPDVTLEVEPYMPDHQHGTSIACHVEPMTAPGQVKLEPVNLFMPGLWEVRLHFTLADDATDEVVFRFCVDP